MTEAPETETEISQAQGKPRTLVLSPPSDLPLCGLRSPVPIAPRASACTATLRKRLAAEAPPVAEEVVEEAELVEPAAAASGALR